MKLFFSFAIILSGLSIAMGQGGANPPETCEQAFKAKRYGYAAMKCTEEVIQARAAVALDAISPDKKPEAQKNKDKLFVLLFARGFSNMFLPRAYGPGEKQNVFTRSAADFAECIALIPGQPMPYYLLGYAQLTALRPEEHAAAAKNFSEAIRLGSRQKDLYYLRARAYENYSSTLKTTAEKNRGYGLAIADYTKSIELKEAENSLNARKALYLKMGKYKEAIDDLSALIIALNDARSDFPYRLERGLAYLEFKKYPEAAKEFTGLLASSHESLEDSRKDILGYRADAYKALGKKAEWCADKQEADEGFDCGKEWGKKK